MNLKKNFKKIFFSTLVIILGFIHLIPIYISLTVSLKRKVDLSSRWFFPKEFYFENFSYALEKAELFLAMKNSFIVTSLCIVLITSLGAMAAYPLARNKTLTNRVVLNLILAVMMVPPLSILVPLLTIMTKVHGVNTYWGIILTLTTFNLPLSIFLYSNFIHTIPRELEEAAMIDGCSQFKTFFTVIFPLLKPITATVIILTGVGIWNDYQFSVYLLQSTKMKVVTLAISSFFSQSSSNLGAAAAAAIIAVLPVITLYLFLQRYFIAGMTSGSIK
ncbi:carbohydrate ABC transporter permease [Candidatus Cetobacterium colombiensis]|uniref:Carbohydrate ABC transporter permease n=1 Tax=Candidatus Cetobacterium colombiensis TaxID=3073100 RepID=A0ABU4W5Y2_9FUSO|nr:carbohydrate ABC transporter permease [Candidatus Cetobacterium colombiensis]MDX8334938.1 carbohydrate ABC transporter permease [Candidatus Cetobacterium colombiensis]